MRSHRQTGIALLFSFLLVLISTSTGYSGTPNVSQPNPVPLINAPLVPDSVAPGGPDLKLTVNGTGFVAGSVVLWNGAALATTFVSASQLTAIVPTADIALPGTASVSVMSPTPVVTSNTVIFDIRLPFSASSFGLSILPTVMAPAFPVSADFNADGKPDIALVASEDAAIAVLLGSGDGTFQPPVEYPAGDATVGLIAGDFNSDGKLDLALCDFNGFVSILLGNGDGTFQSRIDSNSAGFSVGLAAGDFNGDGQLDLAVAISNPAAQVVILLGNGDGTFQPPVAYNAGSTRAFALAVGDFNQDGSLDIAVTVFSDNAVSILLGNGDGTFQSFAQYSTQFGPGSVSAADFNGDSILDLAVQTQLSGWISILIGNGDGTFRSHVDYLTTPGLYGLMATDLNGDGSLDLAISNFTKDTASVFFGRGDGTFRGRSDFPTGNGPVGMAIGDFDGDGRFDVLMANGDGTLSLLPQVTSVLSRTYIKFGNVKVGDASTRKVRLSNIGDTSFTINRIILVGASKSGYTETNNCGSKLAPGENCTITIVFKPMVPVAYRHARLKVSNSEVSVPQKIYLVGTGTN